MAQADFRRSEAVRVALETFTERGGSLADASTRAVATLAEHAPSLLQLVYAEPSLLEDVLRRPLSHMLDRDAMAAMLAATLDGDDEPAVQRALRRFRHRAVVRIALREIGRWADVQETSREMAQLAAVTVDAALASARRVEEARYGGTDVPLTVLGMGKLGGRELNLGSDVDLLFFYAEEGETRETSVHDLFSRVVRRTSRLLGEVTEDGFCFRVDLRLRPEGSRGPLVNSLASAERYYESWGRSWERAALLRASPIAGDLMFGREVLSALRPFVYRRAVDPGVAVAMHEMLLRSRRELKVDEARDVKLGRGGIREAEFFVQSLQLIWGGRDPSLQIPSTLEALERLRAAALVSDREAAQLESAWALLRRVEHRIHVWTGYQTHALPPEGEEREAFAASLGFDDAQTLTRTLYAAREEVAALFGSLLPEASEKDRAWDGLCDQVAAGADLESLSAELDARLPVRDAFEAASHLARLGRRANSPIGPVAWERRPELGRLLLREVADAHDPQNALRFLADFFGRLGANGPYERRLLADARLTRRLVGLFGASGTLAAALIGHPEDLDLLMGLHPPVDDEVAAAHAALLEGLDEDPDPEALVGDLRRLKREFTLRIGLAHVAREITFVAAASHLSALAEGQVEVALEAARRWGERRWGRACSGMIVAALGKLGGRELGFGADLDLVFLYGRDGETEPTSKGTSVTHGELFARVAARTMKLLREPDREGPGFEMDTRLRPSGSKGTLVVSLSAFDAYHAKRAAPWERQALIRARPIAGPEDVREAAATRFAQLAYGAGPPPVDEMVALRARFQTELAAETPDRYHPKLGFGGLWDVELLVQWQQMRHGEDPLVRSPSTGRALRALVAKGVLAGVEGATLEAAYTFFRAVEQSLKLFEEHRPPLLEPHGRTGTHVARALGLRARDGQSPNAVLDATYRHHAEAVRARFEAHLLPVGVDAPWARLEAP
ncbi:MAG: bifunctional [glutamate--ammonia ligase]-adenylyl-L-tyrosine phosphorylase/[glutamate--ammonia-ligase] adenylyltransferase [Sandaracinaceae bacterium]